MIPNLISTDDVKRCLAATHNSYSALRNRNGRRPPYLPRPEDPIYLMLYPSVAAAAQMTALGRQLRLPGRPIDAKRLHVTLHSLCHFARLTNGLLAKIANALSALIMPPFLIGFDRLMNFGRESGPLVLCGSDDSVAGVMMLRDEIASALAPIGLCQRQPSFTPHVTLNYANWFVRERQIEQICWPVRELALVCSRQGQSRHVLIRRWALRAPGWLN